MSLGVAATADQYRIEPGTDVVFEPAGDVIRVVPPRRAPRNPQQRVRLFERMMERHRQRPLPPAPPEGATADRGWTREELYDRGRAR